MSTRPPPLAATRRRPCRKPRRGISSKGFTDSHSSRRSVAKASRVPTRRVPFAPTDGGSSPKSLPFLKGGGALLAFAAAHTSKRLDRGTRRDRRIVPASRRRAIHMTTRAMHAVLATLVAALLAPGARADLDRPPSILEYRQVGMRFVFSGPLEAMRTARSMRRSTPTRSRGKVSGRRPGRRSSRATSTR